MTDLAPTNPVSEDKYAAHFLSTTWQLQGPEFEANSNMNMPLITKETVWSSLDPIKEAIIVGAGPSLKKNREHLGDLPKEVKNFTVLHALPSVIDYCKPDYITLVESAVDCFPAIQEWVDCVDTKELPLIIPSYTDPYVVELWDGPVYWLNVRC